MYVNNYIARNLIQGELLLGDELLQDSAEPDGSFFQVLRKSRAASQVRVHVLAVTSAEPEKQTQR